MKTIPEHPLRIDPERETERISRALREALSTRLRRRGVVLGLSGGVDSSVCAALCARALGPERVFTLLMPESDSSPESRSLGAQVAQEFGLESMEVEISDILRSLGCYEWRDDAIRGVEPEYDGTWPHKLVIRGGKEGRHNHFALVMEAPDGSEREHRLPLRTYLQIVAATNFKQRVRKNLEYFHADRLNYAVVGTPNRREDDQGFFVKNGDGAADFKPIAHLYKTQVYQMGAHLGVPDVILRARPTTDTFSMEQGQDEFYFALPYEEMDLALWAFNHDIPAAALAERLDVPRETAEWIYRDIAAKRRTTRYQHLKGLLVEPVFQDAGDHSHRTERAASVSGTLA